MTASPPKFVGVLPVVQIPYCERGTIDAATFQRLIDWLFDSGADGIVQGMVSEVTRMLDREREEIVSMMVRSAAARGPVVASVGAESTFQAVHHATRAEALGADGLMAIPPALTKFSTEEVKNYYRSIIFATKIPIIIQDASGYLGNQIPVHVLTELCVEFGDRVLFKPEAQPIGPNLSKLRDLTNGKALILEGTGGIALVDSYRRGIVGTMPGSDLIKPIVALWRALEKGDDDVIRAIQGPLTAIIALQTSLDAFLAIEKMLLVEQGIFKNTLVRGPVGYELDAETRTEILRLYALLKTAVES